MIRILEIHPAAQEEAEAAARYLRDAKHISGLCLHRGAGLCRVGARTGSGKFLFGTRRILLEHFPYAVVYRFDENRIVIVAVVHGNRRPGYWVERT